MPGEGVVRGGWRVVAHLGPGPRVVSICGPGPGPSPASWGQRPVPSVKGHVAMGVTDARGALDPQKGEPHSKGVAVGQPGWVEAGWALHPCWPEPGAWGSPHLNLTWAMGRGE